MSKEYSTMGRLKGSFPSFSQTMVRIVAGGSAAMNGLTAFGMLGWGGRHTCLAKQSYVCVTKNKKVPRRWLQPSLRRDDVKPIHRRMTP